MRTIFQKLVNLLLGSDKSSDLVEQSKIEEFDYITRTEPRTEAEVRTKTIYPRVKDDAVEFRFPLIPDERETRPQTWETIHVNTTPDKHKQQLRREQRLTEVSHHQQDEDATSFVKNDQKEPFRPSKFFSPVYGANRPETELRGISEQQQRDDVLPNQILTDVKERRPVTDEIQVDSTESSQQAWGPLLEPSFEPSEGRSSLSIMFVDEPETKPVEESQSSSIPTESLFKTDKNIEVSADELSNDFAVLESSDIKYEKAVEEEVVPSVTKLAEVITFPKKESIVQQDEILQDQQNAIQPTNPINKEETNNRQATAISKWNPDSIERTPYEYPSFDFLNMEPIQLDDDQEYLDDQIEKLTVALESFNVNAQVVGVAKGPTVTRFELQPGLGVKVNKFTNLIDDIKLALAAKDIRMEAPIPGRSAIGIEVPNEQSSPVFIRSFLESEEFQSHESPLAVALGRDIGGKAIIGDLRKMPHGLIAGSTGSGKSVCINSILVSLLYKANPSDVRLILIDPKVVELAPYNHIPHLLTPVVTDPKQATAALKWAVEEMEQRYEKFAEAGARDIARYNVQAEQQQREKMPYILIVIDELADLMMVSPHDVEEAICRIAQKARACGIHLLVATQRPSVDVITGLIKANIPTRIAFAVSSQADSRTILDMGGAERLLGKGDMLYYPSGQAKPIRLQGNFVSDEEIEQVVDHVKSTHQVNYLIDKEELNRSANSVEDFEDELFEEALLFTIEQGQASSSSLQRRFRIGYNRAARLIDLMEAEGFVSGQSGSRPRDVLITMEQYEQVFT
ncbi:hypothetical protein BEP19_00040 [Ammoniphilus oxalaticus]|uniref:FtsK domain-containing protein n=1 Tax=Ammoniphilus oxalaticus TaxID=66863 RepID=A0A419SRE0_9BACL|nr:DNA translocase FtsK [Ammoniphilus oxalaticus]RKD27004.1 hypothetical protein BEP19_00040 [Ammoniphilus oxalaticus]